MPFFTIAFPGHILQKIDKTVFFSSIKKTIEENKGQHKTTRIGVSLLEVHDCYINDKNKANIFCRVLIWKNTSIDEKKILARAITETIIENVKKFSPNCKISVYFDEVDPGINYFMS